MSSFQPGTTFTARTARRARLVLFALVAVTLLGPLSSCNEREETRARTVPRVTRIGFSIDSLVVERWTRDRDRFIQAARSLGAQVEYRNALADVDQQIRDIGSLIDSGVSALVVVPNDSRALTDVINRAAHNGIPVVAYDRLILDADIAAYVSFDNVEVGRLMAQGVLSRIHSGNIVIINGGTKDNNSYLLNQGMLEALRPFRANGSIRLVGEIWPEDWYSRYISPQFEAVLDGPLPIDAVIAGNDLFADTVVDLLSRHRLAGKVIVVGQDADLVACQRLVQGLQHRTIYKPVDKLATRAAELAFQLAIGEQVHSNRSVDNGFKKVPFVALAPIAVEKNNLRETVIADGFHSEEDVYRDTPSGIEP